MTKKISVESLRDFNAANFINSYEEIKIYTKLVKEEGDPAAFEDALSTLFQALGAITIAAKSGLTVSQVWDAQESPLEHPENLQRIIELIESDSLAENAANPYQGGDFEEFLKAEGIYDEVTARAVRRVIAALLKQRSQ